MSTISKIIPVLTALVVYLQFFLTCRGSGDSWAFKVVSPKAWKIKVTINRILAVIPARKKEKKYDNWVTPWLNDEGRLRWDKSQENLCKGGLSLEQFSLMLHPLIYLGQWSGSRFGIFLCGLNEFLRLSRH